MGIPIKAPSQITNDEHDVSNNAKRVNVVAGNISIDASDIQIGAVELKNHDTDDRVEVDTDNALKTKISLGGNDVDSNNKLPITLTGEEINIDNNLEAPFSLINLDSTTTTDVLYIGKQRETDDGWLIQKFDKTVSPKVMSYSSVINNNSYTTYDTAWTNRTTLTYGKVEDAKIGGTGSGLTGSSIANYVVSTEITSLASGSTSYTMMVTNSKQSTFTSFNLHSNHGDIHIEFREAPTTTANGSQLTAYDKNRVNDSTPTLLVYSEPTVTDDGTKLVKHVIPSSNNQVGGQEVMPEEWVLKSSTKYIIKMINNSNQTADLTGNFYWREQ